MPSPGELVCNIPGGVQVCDILDVGKSAAKTAAGGFLGDLAKSFASGFGHAIEMMNTFWVNVPTPALSSDSGALGALRADLGWVTGAVAVLGILIAASKMMLTRSSKPAVALAMGLTRMLFASFVLLPVIALLTAFGDDFSTWVIERSTGGNFGAAMVGVAGGLLAIDPALLLVVALLGILSSLVQIILMLLRIAVMILLAGVIPTLAAGSMTEAGEHAYKKALHWLFAFVLYKPLAAFVYAGAFLAIGQGDGVMASMAGFTLMIVAVIALPALLKLVHPAADAVTGMTEGAAQRHASTANAATPVAKGAAAATAGAGTAVAAGARAVGSAGKWAVSSVSRASY
jgi:type IV secretion system protein TrbL